jgi:hypothetical protein
MADYRDPKVTTSTGSTGRSTGTWVGIAIAVLVLLALLWWLFGAADDADVVAPTTGTVTEEPATTTETAPVTPVDPATTEPTAPAQQ